MTIDQALRLLGYACFASCLAVVWMIAPLYAPHPSSSEAVLMDKCLAVKGQPVLDGWSGIYVGCER